MGPIEAYWALFGDRWGPLERHGVPLGTKKLRGNYGARRGLQIFIIFQLTVGGADQEL